MGGYLIATITTRGAFRAFGISAMVGGVLYFISHHLYLKKKIAERGLKEEKAKQKALEAAGSTVTVDTIT